MKLPVGFTIELKFGPSVETDFILLKRDSGVIKSFSVFSGNFEAVIEQACSYALKVVKAEEYIGELCHQ